MTRFARCSVGSNLSRNEDSRAIDEEERKRRIEQGERLNERLAELQKDREHQHSPQPSASGSGSQPGSRRGSLNSFGSQVAQLKNFNLSSSGSDKNTEQKDNEEENSINGHEEDEDGEKKYDNENSWVPPLSPMALSLVPPSPSKKGEFTEHDDDDGFLYVLDCSSWMWKAGTCATETIEKVRRSEFLDY